MEKKLYMVSNAGSHFETNTLTNFTNALIPEYVSDHHQWSVALEHVGLDLGLKNKHIPGENFPTFILTSADFMLETLNLAPNLDDIQKKAKDIVIGKINNRLSESISISQTLFEGLASIRLDNVIGYSYYISVMLSTKQTASFEGILPSTTQATIKQLKDKAIQSMWRHLESKRMNQQISIVTPPIKMSKFFKFQKIFIDYSKSYNSGADFVSYVKTFLTHCYTQCINEDERQQHDIMTQTLDLSYSDSDKKCSFTDISQPDTDLYSHTPPSILIHEKLVNSAKIQQLFDCVVEIEKQFYFVKIFKKDDLGLEISDVHIDFSITPPKIIKLLCANIEPLRTQDGWSQEIGVFKTYETEGKTFFHKNFQPREYFRLQDRNITHLKFSFLDENDKALSLISGTPTLIKLHLLPSKMHDELIVRVNSKTTTNNPNNANNRFTIRLDEPILNSRHDYKVAVSQIIFYNDVNRDELMDLHYDLETYCSSAYTINYNQPKGNPNIDVSMIADAIIPFANVGGKPVGDPVTDPADNSEIFNKYLYQCRIPNEVNSMSGLFDLFASQINSLGAAELQVVKKDNKYMQLTCGQFNTNEPKLTILKLNSHLARLLGFTQNTNEEITLYFLPKQLAVGSYPMIKKMPLPNYIYLCADFVDYSQHGEDQARVLKAISIPDYNSANGELVEHHFDNLEFVKLKSSRIENLVFLLKTENHTMINFSSSEAQLYVTLVFKRFPT